MYWNDSIGKILDGTRNTDVFPSAIISLIHLSNRRFVRVLSWEVDHSTAIAEVMVYESWEVSGATYVETWGLPAEFVGDTVQGVFCTALSLAERKAYLLASHS